MPEGTHRRLIGLGNDLCFRRKLRKRAVGASPDERRGSESLFLVVIISMIYVVLSQFF
jgi:hypothetical protein